LTKKKIVYNKFNVIVCYQKLVFKNPVSYFP